jgi:hypothetical protein
MSTNQIDLVGATRWLTERFGAAATIQLVNDRVLQIVTEQPPQQFMPPAPARTKWGEVKDYLTSTRQLPGKLVERLHDEGLIYAEEGGRLICLHRDFEERVTGATRIDLSQKVIDGESIDGSNLTGGWYYFQSPRQGSIDRVVVTDDPLEAMAYATLHPDERTTLFLVGHEGGWIPGDKLTGVEVVVATNAQLYNLPQQVEERLPKGESWSHDLQTYLAQTMESIQKPSPTKSIPKVRESYGYEM